MKLPFYLYDLEGDDTIVAMDCNSLVDLPAHSRPFVTFHNERPVMPRKTKFSDAVPVHRIFSEEERIVMGVLISVGTPIYRYDEEIGEYYGIFNKEVTTRIKERMMKQGLMHNLNKMHDGSLMVPGAFMTEIFQLDEKKGILCPEPLKDQNLQDGSLIALYKIEDNSTWHDCQTGKFRGFSIEAYLNIKPATITKSSMKNMKKTKLARVKAGKLSEISKWDVNVDQDSFEVGTALTVTWKDSVTDEPITSQLNDGEYMTEDGKRILVDSDGIVRLVFNKQQSKMSGKNKLLNVLLSVIEKYEDEPGDKVFAQATDLDGDVLYWEGELKEKTPMFIEVNGEKAAAAPGEYQLTLEDGSTKMVTVDDAGLVVSVSDVTEMSSAEILEQVAEVMSRMIKKGAERENALKAAFQKQIDDLKADITALKTGKEKYQQKPPNRTGEGGGGAGAGGSGSGNGGNGQPEKMSLQEMMEHARKNNQ